MVQMDWSDPFPQGFKPATSGLRHLETLVEGPLEDLMSALERDSNLCYDVMNQSEDKRYLPSTFIARDAGGRTFRVGWIDRVYGHQAVRVFDRRAWAVADYLLFSFGIGRLRT